jgi:hypothetical protein
VWPPLYAGSHLCGLGADKFYVQTCLANDGDDERIVDSAVVGKN